MTVYRSQSGASIPVVIGFVGLTVLALGSLVLAVWAYTKYNDQRTNVQAKVDAAVAVAEKEQADRLEAKFLQREKEPNREFAGPSDYGTLGFKYPKTWSVYIENDGSDSEGFTAYLNPVSVPPVSDEQRYALRVSIVNEQYENVIEEYQGNVQEGQLRTTTIKTNGETGTRLDGNFSEDIRGSAVIYKIRDKTAIIRTDANTFKADFDRLIKTITFNR